MKKNPGRKMRREQQREQLAEIRKASKPVPEKEYHEPHVNAVKVNEAKEVKQSLIEGLWDKVKLAFDKSKETEFGKEILKEQKSRLKRREVWKKELGLV